jgi:hypothetical protein
LHYLKRDWLQRNSLKVGEKNVQHPALAGWHNILLPPLHIKLGVMKNFVKPMDRTGSAFKYLAEKFPGLSEAKIKEEVLRSASSSETLCSTAYCRVTRKKAWDAFRLVSTNFLGNFRAENYTELIEDMSVYHKLGCNMSLKIHMLHCHLDFFPDNCGMASDEHGELFVRKLQRRRNDDRESGSVPCWLTAVG